jgi:hypothetical protein
MRYDLLALTLVFLAVLWFMHRRHRAAVKAQRASVFEACLPLFESYRVTQDDIDFPVLTGRYRGYPVRLQPIVDHVAVRKLPSLWLLVTVQGDIPYEGVFDFLVRPMNTEFYSPSASLGAEIEIPPGWPQHAAMRSDAPERMPPLDLLRPHIALFDDPKMKEFLVTPRGVRLVYQANEAARAYYLVLRQAQFEDIVIPAGLVRRLLESAIAVHQTLAPGTQPDDRHERHDESRRSALAV